MVSQTYCVSVVNAREPSSEVRPEGAKQDSPGQSEVAAATKHRPGSRKELKMNALKGQNKGRCFAAEKPTPMSKHTPVTLIGLTLALSIAAGCGSRPATQPFPPPADVAAGDLDATDVLPFIDGPLEEGRNYVYCGTFQLAWNELQDNYIKAPLQLEHAEDWAERLNARRFDKSQLSDEDYIVAVGQSGKELWEKVAPVCQQKFPKQSLRMPAATPDPEFAAYACLCKTLPFQEAFDRRPEPLEFNSATGKEPVAAFGLKDFAYGSDREVQLHEQITILDYVSDDDFILRLNTTSTKDEVILAKMQPKETLLATVDTVEKRIAESQLPEHRQELQVLESVIVPVIEISLDREYDELIGANLLNPGWELWFVTQARQDIRFRLDEHGARLESTAEMAVGADADEPRQMIFDQPFLLMLREKGDGEPKEPYLAVWIENTEVLKPFSEDEAPEEDTP